MADFTCISAAGNSVVRYLHCCFEERQPIEEKHTKVLLVRTEDLNRNENQLIIKPALTFLLYRVDYNKTMRSAWAAMGHRDGEAHLPLDLHFLLTPWAENADHEYRILGRAMQCLENMPIFSGPLLDAITDWAPHEAIQLCLDDLSTEDVMRIFDSLPVDYKLSVPYVARMVLVDGQQSRASVPVTTAVSGVKGGMDNE